MSWTENAPTVPGHYWFFGDPWMGEMGGHYTGAVKPDMELHHVKILRVGQGVQAVVDGQFMPLNKWERVRPGYLGKWCPCVLPSMLRLDVRVKPGATAWMRDRGFWSEESIDGQVGVIVEDYTGLAGDDSHYAVQLVCGVVGVNPDWLEFV